MAHCYVGSEVGTLHRVLLHRPDLELRRLTPSNCDELLFDDVLWVKRARQEHDAFADALNDRGVEVLYLSDLLAETLKDDAARHWLLDRVATSDDHGPIFAPVLRAYLRRWKMEVGVFFDGVNANSPADDVTRIAPDHPVFRVDQLS